jgi:hypothetical protein
MLLNLIICTSMNMGRVLRPQKGGRPKKQKNQYGDPRFPQIPEYVGWWRF